MAWRLSSTTPDGKARVGYFDKSLGKAHKIHFKFLGIAFGLITICAFFLLTIYWGSYYRQEENASRLTIRIIDLDSQASAGGAILGPAVVQAAIANAQAYPNYHLGWQFETNLERFNLAAKGAPTNVTDRGVDADEYATRIVLDQDVFGAIVIHSNATSAAVQSFENGPGLLDYQPQGAISFYYEEARNFYSEDQYVAFHTTNLLAAAIGEASETFAARMVGEQASATGGFNFTGFCPAGVTPAAEGISSPDAAYTITQPFWYSQFNLRPFDAFAAIASTTAGSIYLIIFTFYIGLFFKNTFEPMAPSLTVLSEAATRLIVPGLGYFWISLMYSLLSLAFQVPFDRFYGRVGFFIYWMLNWTTQLGLGYTMELALLVGGPVYFPFFLLLYVIFNVSGAFLDLSDIDHFWLFSYLLPVWNNVDGSKSLIFGTKNHLGQDFGVCLAWMVLSGSGIVFVSARRKSKVIREARAKREEEVQRIFARRQKRGMAKSQ